MLLPTPLRRVALAVSLLLAACSLRSSQGSAGATPPGAPSPAPAQPAAAAAPAERQPSSMRIPITSDDAVWGSRVAPVTIVEFTDLECPFCARVQPTLEQLKKTYGPEKLRLVIKHFPFHEHSELAARYAEAVRLLGDDEAFFRFMALAFEGQAELGSEAALGQWAEASGVKSTAARSLAQSREVSAKLAADSELVQALGITGTPAFFINGAALVGAQPLSDFAALVERELAETQKLLVAGKPAELLYPARVGMNVVPAAAAGRQEKKPEPSREAEEEGVIWKVPIAGTPLRGAKNALVTIVEFSDYECPFCRRAAETMDKLFELYAGKLRLSFRENPLPFHKHALPAAHFALEARAQRGDAAYFEASHRLFLSGLEPAHLDDIAKELKLDVARMRSAVAREAHRSQIERDQELAASLKANGTPHFFINGWRVSGAQPLSRFQEVIDAQLKVAEALVATGVPPARVYDEIQRRAKEPEPPQRWPELPPPVAGLPSRGPKTAPVVIEIWSDLQCPFCARAHDTLAALEKSYAGKLRLVWHHLPLGFHKNARSAARAAIEAQVQKGDAAFFRMVDLFYADQAEGDAFSDERLRKYAAELGLDAERLIAASKDTRHDPLIDADLALAEQAGMSGTPSFSINGYELVGAQPLLSFKRVIGYALSHPAAKAKKKP